MNAHEEPAVLGVGAVLIRLDYVAVVPENKFRYAGD
jgi:hypothetical protein